MRPIYYHVIDKGSPYILRGTNQQTTTGLLYSPPSLSGLSTVTTGAAGTGAAILEGLTVGSINLQNRSGSTTVVGVGVRLANIHWLAGQWTNAASTPFVDATTTAQGTTSTFALETTTNNDGYVIASDVPFNALSLNITTAGVGAGTVRAIRYTNAAGTGWTNYGTNLFLFNGSSGALATGEAVVVFTVPADWGKITGSGLSGIPPGYYAVNVRATTAPSTAAVATGLEALYLYQTTENVTDNTSIDKSFGAAGAYWPFGDGLVALFGTADVGNRVSALVKPGKW